MNATKVPHWCGFAFSHFENILGLVGVEATDFQHHGSCGYSNTPKVTHDVVVTVPKREMRLGQHFYSIPKNAGLIP